MLPSPFTRTAPSTKCKFFTMDFPSYGNIYRRFYACLLTSLPSPSLLGYPYGLFRSMFGSHGLCDLSSLRSKTTIPVPHSRSTPQNTFIPIGRQLPIALQHPPTVFLRNLSDIPHHLAKKRKNPHNAAHLSHSYPALFLSCDLHTVLLRSSCSFV